MLIMGHVCVHGCTIGQFVLCNSLCVGLCMQVQKQRTNDVTCDTLKTETHFKGLCLARSPTSELEA